MADESDTADAGTDGGVGTDDAPEDGGAADSLRERGGTSAATTYLLIGADRRVLAAGLLGVLFLGLLGAATLMPGAERAVRTGDPIETLYQALVGATVTGVTLVLTLNQLVLSQELGAVGDQRERMEGAMAFRDDAADHLADPTAPAEPSAFLRALVAAAADHAQSLADALGDDADSVTSNADHVIDALEGASFGSFAVVGAALDFEYSQKLYRARRLEAVHGDALPAAASGALRELTGTLRLFGPAREHFKTLYFQQELVGLSRAVLATAVPSLVVAVAMLTFFEPAAAPSLLVFDGAVVAVCATTAVTLAPFVVLLAYVLRIATVTGRTLSIGPFVLRESDREGTTETD